MYTHTVIECRFAVHTGYVQRVHCWESSRSWMILGRYGSEEDSAPGLGLFLKPGGTYRVCTITSSWDAGFLYIPPPKGLYRPILGRYVHESCYRMQFWCPYKVCTARAMLGELPVLDDSGPIWQRRRFGPWSRSVSEGGVVPGAGLFFPAGPAPQIGLLRSPVAQEGRRKTDLYQITYSPAPENLLTCARHTIQQD